MPCDPCVAADARERVGGIDADVLDCAAILIAGARDSTGAALAGVKKPMKTVGPKLAANAVRGSKIKRPFKIVGPTPRAGGVNMRVKESPGLVTLSDRYAPYDARGVQIDNIGGMFSTYVEVQALQGLIVEAITPFGVQHTLFHVDGNLVVDRGRGFYQACR